MDTSAFAPLGILQIPFASKLLPSACCPDKDLVVLISRFGGQDRLSLWNYGHGSKVWEVDAGVDESSVAEIIAFAWSPDGQSIAVVHDPPQITLHSLQDGSKQLTIPVPSSTHSRACRLAGVWWFRDVKSTNTESIPDIFKRNDVITGTAHAVLQILPLLDNLQEDSQKMTATDLFAFQGSQTKPHFRLPSPDVIDQWPSLFPDPLAASISSASPGKLPGSSEGLLDEVDNTNKNSILAVTDNEGYLHCFLDGSFPLGAVSLGSNLSVRSMFKDPKRPVFFAHASALNEHAVGATSLQPIVIDLSMLGKRHARDMAKLSSTARELMWYIIRVVKEMHIIWFGSETFSGARELGPKWILALETKQQEQFGHRPNAILDLTTLLVAGRTSDSLLDFLGSSEQMSERGTQKWESTMTEALVKLRDFSEKRIIPACQRLHLVLEELQGWSQLPQYASYELSLPDINDCLEMASRAILLSAWLASTARRDLSRFKDFISWLRHEASAANPTNDTNLQPRHDILEVNNYFISGLVTNAIDQWFVGPVPQFSLDSLGIPPEDDSLVSVLERARKLANDMTEMAWRNTFRQTEGLEIDRNLDALLHELAVKCRTIFDRAAGAVCRLAVTSATSELSLRLFSAKYAQQSTARERTVALDEKGEFLQYLAMPLSSEQGAQICVVRLRFRNEASESPLEVGIALLEPFLPVEGEESPGDLDLLEADFFDDECVVIVYRLRNISKPTYIATLRYSDLGYRVLRADEYVKMASREDLMLEAVKHWKEGHLPSARSPIKRSRALVGCNAGEVSLALNGRPGRRVACVLDSKGITLESFDVEGDADDAESEGETL
ncbi:Anaphase-promoting complex subunit 4 [Hypsizygus marmoreus]|uniref:Anaphase-promoting complex subunit 4 n=1 Tax=Hypsizygus marmoreus TaxID=39966 RepID=A0A369K4J7_HYPMA|nr:Anaphase-promoting complex subunit 4 [Hypsizygus marmoreus]